MGRSVTSLLEVAQRSGVSIATASRALDPDSAHPVSTETREKVVRIATQLRFHHNAVARSLRSRRTKTVGVIVHDVRDPYFNECARAVSDAAVGSGYLTVVCNTDRDPATELRYVTMLRENRVAGLLFVGGGLEDAKYRYLMADQVRAIREYGGAVIALGPRHDPWPAEVPDNRGGAVLATRHLIDLGHRRIAFLDGPPALTTSTERLAGYQEALQAARIRLDPGLVVCGHYSVDGGAAVTAGLLNAGSEFTAVFASNDAMAIGCRMELQRRGVRVPADLSLVGFDDVPSVAWLDPPLTTVAVPMAAIGSAGVRRLLEAIGGGAPRRPRIAVHETRLVVRGSTGPPARYRALGTPAA